MISVRLILKPALRTPSTNRICVQTESGRKKKYQRIRRRLNIGIGNWSVGGSYHYTNMSRKTAEFLNPYANVAKGSSWDAGVKFSAGPFAASANVFQSRADSLTVDGKKTYSVCISCPLNIKFWQGLTSLPIWLI